jgi:hypothetical protein
VKSKDTIQVVVSDFHTGSNYALFIAGEWKGTKEQSHTPRSAQVEIRKHFEKFTEQVKQLRKGKRLILVHNGDAVDGDHHNSGDVCTVNVLEQARIHIDLMSELQKRIGWQAGDTMYYTRGTQSHVNEYENYIGQEMDAVPNGDYFVHDLLQLDINGVRSWFVHHGPARGEGANEGNSMRNWLRNIYFEAHKDGSICPQIVYTGHVHNPTYSTYVYQSKMQFQTMHGVILPSWQGKTIYAHRVAPYQKNKIGGVIHEIKEDGTITVPKFSIMGY